MGLWSKGVDRSETGEIRKEDDLKNMIDEFFSNQEEKVPYEIVDDKNWIVDIDGNLHLNQSDLDEGKLFFKIGKLSGNLYFHGKHMSPSVIPDQMEGDIIFIPDEEELARTRGQKGNKEEELDDLMHALSENPPSKSKVTKLLETAFTECLANGYDIDVQEILTRLKEEWENRDRFKLNIDIKQTEYNIGAHHIGKREKLECNFFISSDDIPLKLSAIEKAVYLLYILHPEGLPLILQGDVVRTLKKIYNKLQDAVPDEVNGILGKDDFIRDTTINGYRFHIRKEIHKQI